MFNSLQRSTHTEIPTLARSQHKAFICFGVGTAEDAEYGLSDAQQEAEAANKVLGELVALGALNVDTEGPAHVFTVVDLDPLTTHLTPA